MSEQALSDDTTSSLNEAILPSFEFTDILKSTPEQYCVACVYYHQKPYLAAALTTHSYDPPIIALDNEINQILNSLISSHIDKLYMQPSSAAEPHHETPIFGSHVKCFHFMRHKIVKLVGKEEAALYEWVKYSKCEYAKKYSNFLPRIYSVNGMRVKMEKIGCKSNSCSIMDVKLGYHSRPEGINQRKKAKELQFQQYTFQGSLGIRIKGYNLFNNKGQLTQYKNITVGLSKRERLNTKAKAIEIFKEFLTLNYTMPIQHEAVTAFLSQIVQLMRFLRAKTPIITIGSSLLFAYSPYDRLYQVKLIDFNYSTISDVPVMDYNVIQGVESVIWILQQILNPE